MLSVVSSDAGWSRWQSILIFVVRQQQAVKPKSIAAYAAENPNAVTGAASVKKSIEAGQKRVIREDDGFYKCRNLGCGQFYGEYSTRMYSTLSYNHSRIACLCGAPALCPSVHSDP